MRPGNGDTTIAFKVIGVLQALSTSDKGVAAAVIDHVNHKSGRCDPRISRIAAILGVSKRTVIRSMNRLVMLKLFEKIRHGSYSGRNLYYPNWERFRDFDRIIKARGKKPALSAASELSPDVCQERHLGNDATVTRTSSTNLSRLTCPSEAKLSNPPAHPKSEAQFGLPRGGKTPPSASRTVPHPACRSMTPHRAVARTSARRRWEDALRLHFASNRHGYGEAVSRIDTELADAATEAELKTSGAGIALILISLTASLPGAEA